MRKRGKVESSKFTVSDWVVLVIVGTLILCGFVFGLFKLAEIEQRAIDDQTSSSIENDGEVRGSAILDIFVNKKTALIVVVDECNEGTACSNYLSEFFADLISIKKSAPQVLIFDLTTARERGDTNLNVALQELKVNNFPTLLVINNGMEASRKEGVNNDNGELYTWLVENGIIADDKNSGN